MLNLKYIMANVIFFLQKPIEQCYNDKEFLPSLDQKNVKT
jgi:hypothetical protein